MLLSCRLLATNKASSSLNLCVCFVSLAAAGLVKNAIKVKNFLSTYARGAGLYVLAGYTILSHVRGFKIFSSLACQPHTCTSILDLGLPK